MQCERATGEVVHCWDEGCEKRGVFYMNLRLEYLWQRLFYEFSVW